MVDTEVTKGITPSSFVAGAVVVATVFAGGVGPCGGTVVVCSAVSVVASLAGVFSAMSIFSLSSACLTDDTTGSSPLLLIFCK